MLSLFIAVWCAFLAYLYWEYPIICAWYIALTFVNLWFVVIP